MLTPYKFNLGFHEDPPVDPLASLTPEQLATALSKVPKDKLFAMGPISSLVNDVRTQEKTKLYNEINTTKEMVTQLKEANDRAQAEKEAAVELAKKEARDRMTTEERIRDAEAQAQQRMREFEERTSRTLLETQQSFANFAVTAMRQQAAAEAQVPLEFREYITGNTPEEIAASVDKIKSKLAVVAPATPPTPATPVVATPGAAPGTQVPTTGIMPPTNGGHFDPAQQAILTNPVNVKDYVSDPDKRQAELDSALALAKTFFNQ